MPLGGGLAAGAGALGSSLIGSSAASSAASQQVAAEQQALALQQQMYSQTRKDLQPYRTTGESALDSIANMYGLATGNGKGANAGTGTQNFSAFTNSPDYAFALQQGNQAVNATAAANGQLMSGGQIAAAQTFGQGLASQQFSNYYNRLLGLSNMGESAAAQTANANQSAANSMSSIEGSIGASEASGTIGSANALTGGISALSGLGMLGRTGSSYTPSIPNGGAGSYGLGGLTSLGSSGFGNTFSGNLLSSIF